MAEPELFLFVSHVHEDRTAALEIVDELERRGVPCWIAPRNVRPGKPFDEEIADALAMGGRRPVRAIDRIADLEDRFRCQRCDERGNVILTIVWHDASTR